jgi:predicted transcriptional regulator
VLPRDAEDAQRAVAEEMRARIRTAGKSNLSRAVSELVNAGFLRRHYQGYRIDHQNRGGQRHAVYTLVGDARLLGPTVHAPKALVQGEFAFTG